MQISQNAIAKYGYRSSFSFAFVFLALLCNCNVWIPAAISDFTDRKRLPCWCAQNAQKLSTVCIRVKDGVTDSSHNSEVSFDKKVRVSFTPGRQCIVFEQHCSLRQQEHGQIATYHHEWHLPQIKSVHPKIFGQAIEELLQRRLNQQQIYTHMLWLELGSSDSTHFSTTST